MSLPVIMTAAGAAPQSPTSLNAQIIDLATASNPGLTANLPGTLIEDISSTDTAALVLVDQAQVETINSMTPYGANLYLLNQLGQIYGVQQGVGSNTSVYVVFSGTPGYAIPKGIFLTDGTYQYITQDPAVINSGGISDPVYAVATVSGSWAVPANSVTTIASAVPTGVSLGVTNPNAGIPSTSAQSPEDYRAQVLQAGLVACSGSLSAVKNALQNLPGVVQSLVSIVQAPSEANQPVYWQVIVEGGDKFAVANAIYNTINDPGILVGSTLNVTNITKANPGVVTTGILHGYTTGQTVTMTGVQGMTAVNGVPYTVTVITPYTFSIGVDTSSYGAYTGGGVCSPNSRNMIVTINDPPNSYQIPFIMPPQQTVTIAIQWAATSLTTISSAVIAQYASQNISNYVNGIGPGGGVNFFEIQNIFQNSVASILPTQTLVTINISAIINGIPATPPVGENIVYGDPQGYYYCPPANITYTQG
jgi:Ubiquitin-activating enzyme E1 FCCH domain/Baseplate J-like protein